MFICPKVSKNIVKNMIKSVTKVVATVLAVGSISVAVAGQVPTTDISIDTQNQPLLMAPASECGGVAWHSSHYSHSSHSSHRSHYSHYSSR